MNKVTAHLYIGTVFLIAFLNSYELDSYIYIYVIGKYIHTTKNLSSGALVI